MALSERKVDKFDSSENQVIAASGKFMVKTREVWKVRQSVIYEFIGLGNMFYFRRLICDL